VETPRRKLGFHSVGSRSDLWSCRSYGIREMGLSWYSDDALDARNVMEGRVGDEGCEMDSRDKLDAERGFAASLRRHASLQ